jgi:hypothetical protein
VPISEIWGSGISILDYKYILLVKVLACLALVWVVSKYSIYITGLLQFWITHSFFNAIEAVEGATRYL